jgi:hypothetical protein
MERFPGQTEGERTVPTTYRAEILATRGGEEVQLDLRVSGSSIRELAEHLVGQASELESEAKEKLDRTETERDKSRRAERSGRRRRSWE